MMQKEAETREIVSAFLAKNIDYKLVRCTAWICVRTTFVSLLLLKKGYKKRE